MYVRYLLFAIGAFLAGVFLASFYPLQFLSLPLFALLSLLLLVAILILSPKNNFFALFLFLGFFLGFLYCSFFLKNPEQRNLDVFTGTGEELCFQGEVISRPLLRKGKQKAEVQVHHICELPEYEFKAKALVSFPQVKNLHYGESIRFSAQVEKPLPFSGDGGRVFGYPKYLQKDGIFYLMRARQVQVVGQSRKGVIYFLYTLKDRLLGQMKKILPQESYALLAGVLLGEKTALGTYREEQFRDTGMMHIVVLSGYNVSLVVLAVMFFLRPFPLIFRSLVSILFIVLFALAVGAGPTVVRASLMAIFLVFGRVFGREYRIERGLLIAAFFMVIYNPLILAFDISFQLSFLATYALIVLPPLIEPYFKWFPNFLFMRDSLVATLSAQLFIAPLILYRMGSFSIVSPLVNMLVLFMVPLVMLFGFLMVIFSFLIPALVLPFVALTNLGLSYILMVVEFFAQVPYASIQISSFSLLVMIFVYLLIFIFVFFHLKRQNKHDIL